MLTPQIADKGVTKHILRAFDLHASRRLGQNFLISPGVVRAVVEAAERKGVVEVARGLGVAREDELLAEVKASLADLGVGIN